MTPKTLADYLARKSRQVQLECPGKFEPLERAVPIQLKNFQSGHPRSALLSVRCYVAQDQTPPPEGQWAECARRKECGRVEPALRPPRKCRAESHLALLYSPRRVDEACRRSPARPRHPLPR